jgi:tetratricopeptide (TPR) repeat protein
MKAEHRKESPTRVVAEHARHLLNDLKTRPSRSSLVFWIAVVLVAALIVGWYAYSNREKRAASIEWTQLGTATDLAELDALDKDHPGTKPALLAQFQKARVLLREGLDGYAAGEQARRDEARDKIKQAGDLYRTLAGEVDRLGLSRSDQAGSLLKMEALRGAATAYESQNELDEALTYYRQLADLGQQLVKAGKPEPEDARHAAEKVAQLEDPEKKKELEKFYANLLNEPAPIKAPITP